MLEYLSAHHLITSGCCCVQAYWKHSCIIVVMCLTSLIKLLNRLDQIILVLGCATCCRMVSTISDLWLLTLHSDTPLPQTFPSVPWEKGDEHWATSLGDSLGWQWTPVYAGQSAYLTLSELPTLEMGTGTSPSVGGVPTLQTDLTQVGKDLKMWLPKSVFFAYGKMVSSRPPTEPYLSRKIELKIQN